MKVLVVDDEKLLVKGIKFNLENDGYEVLTGADGVEAVEIAAKEAVDLVVLDLMMPRMDGLEACQKIREFSDVPIIMLTAKADDMDKLLGFEHGADDYLTKPFNPLELVARVKAQLRRYTRYNEPDKAVDSRDIIDFNGLVINRATHECSLYDQELNLTPIEFDILWMLCENRGQVISAERLFESVWGEKYLDRNNTVMVHIRRLREKMGEPSRNPRFIKTVWGVGYKID